MAGAKPEWDIARLAATLALNTTMRGCELKGLSWRDVDFMERVITVQRTTTKTDAGERVIPLNPDAWQAILQLHNRVTQLLGQEPEPNWYVFPHAEGKTKPDPTRPHELLAIRLAFANPCNSLPSMRPVTTAWPDVRQR
jgi:integrase